MLSKWYDSLPRPLKLMVALSLMLAVAALDYETGNELSFSIFYLAPIGLVAWFVGRRPGLVLCLLSASLWWKAEIMGERTYSNATVIYWNTCVRLGFFLIFNQLVGRVRYELTRVRELSQRDHLTGAVNRRYFTELAEIEIARTARSKRSLSLAYIDLDNFKTVNDTMGHETGDQILTTLVKLLIDNLRRPDVVARIGGDEFLVLMPETDIEQARNVVNRLLDRCGEAVSARGWPIGLSIGVAGTARLCSLKELISAADAQMYNAKQGGKNRAFYSILDSDEG